MMLFFCRIYRQYEKLNPRGGSSMCAGLSEMNMVACLQAVRFIVFDLDDTLFPERQYVHSGFRAVSAYLHDKGVVGQDLFPAMWRWFNAGEHSKVFNRVLEEYGIVPQKNLIDALVTVYRIHRPEIALYPDARTTLAYFHDRKPLALLSDGYLQTQTAKLETLGIRRYFSAIVLTDQLGRACWKPSPAGFEEIMQTLGGDPAAYVYIGDNPKKDFTAPHRLGWQSIRVRRPEGVYAGDDAPHDAFEADFVVEDLYQAARLIDPDFTAS
jgi:putative hydrolase of the HAD superfamily